MASTCCYRLLGRFLLIFILVLLWSTGPVLAATGLPPISLSTARGANPSPAARAQMLASSQGVALGFEANNRQTDAQVKFLSRGRNYTLFLTSHEAVFALQPSVTEPQPQPTSLRSPAVVRLQLLNANPTPVVEPDELLPGQVNYYLGNDPAHWRLNVSRYGKIHYRDVYPGIDVIYHSTQGQLEYDLRVAAKADPRQIRLAFANAQNVTLDENGDLLIHTQAGVLRQRQPEAYQEVKGERRRVKVRYAVRSGKHGEHHVALKLGRYDRSKPLIIDPVIVYSTFFGGSSRDFGNAVAVDGTGFLYIAGRTDSIDFPGASNPPGGFNAFIAKLMPAGNGAADLIYATYVGGSTAVNVNFSPTDSAEGITVDQVGNTYVTGFTFTGDFPTTAGTFQPQSASTTCGNAFVARFNTNGALSYSTYLGSTGCDFGQAITLDSAGDVIVVGTTRGSDFPTTAGAFREAVPSQGGSDAFVSKLRLTGQGANDLLYSTLIGGLNSEESGLGAQVDPTNNIYAVGETLSDDFPTTPGAIQSTLNGSRDAFFVKLNPAGQGASDLVYGTYLGGSNDDIVTAVAVDSQKRAYVTGSARAGFPTTPTAYQQTSQGLDDVILAVIDPAVAGPAGLLYSSYLGGTSVDEGTGIALDTMGRVWLTGTAESSDFPTDAGPADPGACVAVFNPALVGTASLVSSMVLGDGEGNSIAAGLGAAVNPPGKVVVVGNAGSTFPTTPGAFQETTNLGGDAFLAVLDQLVVVPPAVTSLQLLSSVTPSFVGQTVTFTAALTAANQQVPTGTVRFEDNGTPLSPVNIDAQGNAVLMTSTLALGNHTITAIYDGNATFLGSSNSLVQRVTEAVDLAIVKTVSATTVSLGQALTYTLAVTNHGPANGTGVVVRDTLPANVTVNSIPAGCSQAGNVVTCAIGNFAANSTANFTIIITPIAPGLHINTATVEGNEADPVPGNNLSKVATTVEPVDLAVTLTDEPDPVGVGGTLTYTIGVANNGPSTATNVVMTFTRDSSLTFSSFTSNGLSGLACGGQNVVTCSLASLASGTQGTVTLSFTTTTTGMLTATASIASSNPETDTGNNTVSTTTRVALSADLAVALSAMPDPVTVDGTITYTITWSNLGPATSTGPTVSGELSGAITFDVNSLGGPDAGFAQCNVTPTTFTCQVGRLFGGESATITLQAKPTSQGTVVLSASVSGAEVDPDTENNRTFAETTVRPLQADMEVLRDLALQATPVVGQQATLEGDFRNNGPDTATGVGLTFSFSSPVTVASGVSGSIDCLGGTAVQTVTCTARSPVRPLFFLHPSRSSLRRRSLGC